MKNFLKTKFNFIIDPRLIEEDRAGLLVRFFQEEKIKFNNEAKCYENDVSIIFTNIDNLRSFFKYKNSIFVLDINDNAVTESVEKINFNSYEDIACFIGKIFFIEKISIIKTRIKESDRYYEKIKMTNNQLVDNNEVTFINDQKRDLESLLDLEIILLKEKYVENWNGHFKNFTKKHGKLQFMSIFDDKNLLLDEWILDENAFIFNLPIDNLFLALKFKNNEDLGKEQCLELIVTMVLRTIQIHDQQLVKNDGEIEFWKKIFSKIPYPMAVISNLGDLLIYNESFAKIGILPKECLRFKDQESLEIFQQFYKIRRIEFSINLIDVSYFVFYSIENRDINKEIKGIENDGVEKENRKGTIDELGIISSSIAHELNNPLAGILAALSLLSLENDWSRDALSDLDDMKNGAKRCKELINIFLGFSKISPLSSETPSIKDSMDQAINLLRFRMIESNLRLDIKYSPTLEFFSRQINSSIMSMVLYLILSELMTSFAHERLITQLSSNAMSGEVLEFSNQIIIRLDNDFEYEEKLAQSKLIQHLLVFEKLEINFLKKEIRLIHRL